MLKGFFRLDRIPRQEIFTTQNGSVGIFVEIHEKLEKDKYGCTHYAKMRVKGADGTFSNVYLGDFRPEEFGQKGSDIDLTPLPPASTPETDLSNKDPF